MVAEFKKRRAYIHEALKTIPGLKVNDPEGAFYMFPDVSAFFNKSFEGTYIKNADDLCMYLLHKANVSTVTGVAFEQPNCIRLSYATSMANLEKGVERLKTWLGKLA